MRNLGKAWAYISQHPGCIDCEEWGETEAGLWNEPASEPMTVVRDGYSMTESYYRHLIQECSHETL